MTFSPRDHGAAARRSKSATRSRARGRTDERGASLILAMVYVISISLVVGALADWAMNDLNNTAHFRSSTALNYAVSSTAQVAIQSMRYNPQMPATASPALANCWTPTSGYVSELTTVNNDPVAIWCSTVQNLASSSTRVVTMYACQTTLTASSTSADAMSAGVACQTKPLLTVQVTFDDYLPGGLTLTQTCTTTCGLGAKIDKWIWAS